MSYYSVCSDKTCKSPPVPFLMSHPGMSVAVSGYPATIRPIAYITHEKPVSRNGNSSAAEPASASASSPSSADASSSGSAGGTEERQLNPWRLVVDREMGGEAPRVARVVDLAAVQAHARAEPGTSSQL